MLNQTGKSNEWAANRAEHFLKMTHENLRSFRVQVLNAIGWPKKKKPLEPLLELPPGVLEEFRKQFGLNY